MAFKGGVVRPGIWGKLAGLDEGARPVQREALEFLGGLLVHEKKLDHEPVSLTGVEEGGPSICDLADEMLRGYVRRTGINWKARTVLGKNPFLVTDTEVVRIRFPDWSLWNLPLMAHEFGHLAALATPAFLEYQSLESGQITEGHPRPETVRKDAYLLTRRRHLDELFADIFATYTLGPAFICNVILFHLNPSEAYLPRGAHPSHQERFQIILQTLREMNEKVRQVYDLEPYTMLLAKLNQGWNETVQVCQASPEDLEVYNFQLKQTLRWGRNLYRIIDKFFRLGVSYNSKRWMCAQKIAERLMYPPVPEFQKMKKIATDYSLDDLYLDDILNALWWARVAMVHNSEQIAYLTFVSIQIGHNYLSHVRGKT